MTCPAVRLFLILIKLNGCGRAAVSMVTKKIICELKYKLTLNSIRINLIIFWLITSLVISSPVDRVYIYPGMLNVASFVEVQTGRLCSVLATLSYIINIAILRQIWQLLGIARAKCTAEDLCRSGKVGREVTERGTMPSFPYKDEFGPLWCYCSCNWMDRCLQGLDVQSSSF